MAAPERIDVGGGLVLRRCHPADAEALYLAIVESREHLWPWTPWVTRANLEEERAVLVRWEEQWDGGGELQYGLFLGPLAVGFILPAAGISAVFLTFSCIAAVGAVVVILFVIETRGRTLEAIAA